MRGGAEKLDAASLIFFILGLGIPCSVKSILPVSFDSIFVHHPPLQDLLLNRRSRSASTDLGTRAAERALERFQS
jgi:hypothetical protein